MSLDALYWLKTPLTIASGTLKRRWHNNHLVAVGGQGNNDAVATNGVVGKLVLRAV
jgi:hypothetical protein